MAQYNYNFLTSVVLADLAKRVTLAGTVMNLKDSTSAGKVGESVSVYLDPLKDVTVKTYTKVNKAANDEYIADTVEWVPFNVTLTDEIYAMVQIDGWDNIIFDKNNISEAKPEIDRMASKLANEIERGVGSVINSLSGVNVITETLTGTTAEEKGKEVISKLAELSFDFDAAGVPSENRYAAVGRQTYLNLLASKEIISAANSGDNTNEALRKAVVGVVAGFQIIPSNSIDTDSLVAYQQDAFGVISRAPGKNISAPYSELISVPGAPIDIRANVLPAGFRDATGLKVSTFYTVAPLVEKATDDNPRAKKVTFA